MKDNPVRNRFLVFGQPVMGPLEIQEVVESLNSGWIGSGPKVTRFEQAFRAYKGGAFHAVAVNSCTAALHLSLLAAGIGAGDEVITTAMTFCATVNTIIHVGATPVLVDIDLETGNIDPSRIEERISPQTRAIIVVHYGGRPCAMDSILALAATHGLKVIEDCAHAIESRWEDRPIGTLGDFGCFSFYVTKNLVTGEGGMVLARDEAAATQVKILSLHGMTTDAWKRFGDGGFKQYRVVAPGYKYNMMDLQAAIGLHQLRRLEKHWLRRQSIWATYQKAFSDLPLRRPPEPTEQMRHAYHLYHLLLDEKAANMTRDAFVAAMTAENIGVSVHYLAIPEHPYYQERYGWRPDDYPQATEMGQRVVTIPISPWLSDADVADVIQAVRKVLNRI